MKKNIISFVRQKDYKYIKDIGQWWTWKTILLEDTIIREKFVCKKYLPFYSEDKDLYFENFKEEIKLLHLVYHPLIVRVFNYYLYPEEKTWYILMEFIEWTNIKEYIEINPDKLNSLFKQVIEWFVHLEDLNILHRDIRPENILVDQNGKVKIIDFGFWKNITNENNDKSISINWRYDIPDEFWNWIYDKQTEIYFIWKLFEDIIKDYWLENFKYNHLLQLMIKKNPLKRIEYIFDIYSMILSEQSDELSFTNEEKEIYNSFANSLNNVLANIWDNITIIKDIEKIIEKLSSLYKNSLLENSIFNNSKIIDCFISWKYKFYKSRDFRVDTLKDFLDMIKSLDIEKRTIIMNHIWQRIESTDKIDDEISIEDLPF